MQWSFGGSTLEAYEFRLNLFLNYLQFLQYKTLITYFGILDTLDSYLHTYIFLSLSPTDCRRLSFIKSIFFSSMCTQGSMYCIFTVCILYVFQAFSIDIQSKTEDIHIHIIWIYIYSEFTLCHYSLNHTNGTYLLYKFLHNYLQHRLCILGSLL